jgi:hypothetical protein
MSNYKPFRDDARFWQGDTLAYSFTFTEDDVDLNLTTFDDIVVEFKNRDTTVFEHSVSDGDLTISGGGNNKISGVASATTMDIAVRKYDMVVYFTSGTVKNTWVSLDVLIINENKSGSSTGSEFTVNIDTTATTVTGQASAVVVEPNGVILVDGRYSGNSGTKYDDIDLAITAARARIADDWSKATIKAYLDASGDPIGLGTSDILALRAEGIFFESPFDAWEDFVFVGGNLNNDDLLYNIDNENLKIDLVN